MGRPAVPDIRADAPILQRESSGNSPDGPACLQCSDDPQCLECPDGPDGFENLDGPDGPECPRGVI